MRRGRTPAPGVVRADRRTIFGNPVVIGAVCPECGRIHLDGPATLPCYQAYLERRLLADPPFREAVAGLAGAEGLACWCADLAEHRPLETATCHTEVLAEAALRMARG